MDHIDNKLKFTGTNAYFSFKKKKGKMKKNQFKFQAKLTLLNLKVDGSK